MNLYHLFYWITAAERVQDFFQALAVTFLVFVCIAVSMYIVAKFSFIENVRNGRTAYPRDKTEHDDKADGNFLYVKWAKRMFYIFIPLASIFWILYIATPSKSDTVLIVAGGAVGQFVMSDSSAKKLPSDVTNFLHEKIGELAREAKSGVVPTQQDQKIKELEGMTKDQILEKLKTDSTISKLVP